VPALDGLRGGAVLLVFLVHYVALLRDWTRPQGSLAQLADALERVGSGGVELFFVLSGYLIYRSLLNPRQRLGPFLLRRLRRIYPAFTAVFALYVALSYLVPSENKIPRTAGPAALYLVENYLLLPGIFAIKPLITVAWSLSYEMCFYVTASMLLLTAGVRAWSPRRRATAIALCMAGGVVAYVSAGAGPVKLIVFFAGMLLYEYRHNLHGRSFGARASITSVCVAFCLVALPLDSPLDELRTAVSLSIAYFMLCAEALGNSRSPVSRWCSVAPLRQLGVMSYSYYLTHGLTLKAAFAVARMFSSQQPQLLSSIAMLPVCFFISLVPGAFLYLLVESKYT
jgi:exopolysaccharide production protein ExoZ